MKKKDWIETYDIFIEVLKKKSIKELSEELFIHVGTIKRWLLLKSVPDSYFLDLNRLLNYKYKRENLFLDQYFTKPEIASYCLEVLKSKIENFDDYTFIEPSAGNGSFYNLLPKEKRIGVDIEPKIEGIIESNYYDFYPEDKEKNIVIGNPPFGLRGNTALRFIRYSFQFADYVAFILPPMFNSTGKGVPATRLEEFSLIHTENLPLNSFIYPDGNEVEVSTIFNIYSKDKCVLKKKDTCDTFIKIYSLSDGGTPSSTRNKKMLNSCDIYLPSTTFSDMNVFYDFESLPLRRGYGIVILKDRDKIMDLFKKIDLKEKSFLGTNSSLNLNFEKIKDILIENGFKD